MDYKLVSAGIMFKENKVLVQKRPEGKPLAGLYEFPGGKLEEGETFNEAIVRELKEELDIQVCPYTIQPVSFILHDQFVIQSSVVGYTGEMKPMIGQELYWADPVELLKMNMLPSNFKILSDVLKACPTRFRHWQEPNY